MCVMAPKNKWELADMLKFAIAYDGPIALRYPRGEAYDGLKEFRAPIVRGKSELIYDESGLALVAVGSMVKTAIEVREMMKALGYNCTVVNARFVKPVDEAMLTYLAQDHRLVVTMEENIKHGGFGEKVLEYYNETGADVEVLQAALPDEYIEHGNVDLLKQETCIDAESIFKRIIAQYLQ
jgi:1-deoxy-D-xylulose-5-phosphate synthase